MSDSIFGSLAMKQSPSGWASPRSVSVREPAKPAQRARLDDRDEGHIAILEAPLLPGETAHGGFARKEAELRTAFAALSVIESRALHSRLSNPRSGDRLAAAFMRMTGERRARLINFLADARRREALRR